MSSVGTVHQHSLHSDGTTSASWQEQGTLVSKIRTRVHTSEEAAKNLYGASYPFPLCCPQLQVIIIIYLSVVGALLLYMAFLVLVDPLIRKPDPYTQPLHNEEDSEVRGARGAERGPGERGTGKQ